MTDQAYFYAADCPYLANRAKYCDTNPALSLFY